MQLNILYICIIIAFTTMKHFILFIILCCSQVITVAQSKDITFTGIVHDEDGNSLPSTTITIEEIPYSGLTDRNGAFSINIQKDKIYTLNVNLLGFVSYTQKIKTDKNTSQIITLKQDNITLNEIVIKGNKGEAANINSPLNITHIDNTYIQENFSGSLMQTLEKIPGVKAMSIGSGQSKPAIRGLGFNRMLIAENGIKHEGQQWGEDHGLEIDQFAIDDIEIIKGPGSLLYGSDAIGGVINLKSSTPLKNSFDGKINIFGRSNNESIGISASLQGRKDKFFYKAHATLIDYADYKVPVDSIEYYSYYFRLKDRRLRNTAGKEHNAHITLGWIDNNFKSVFSISDVYSKSGFFANAHGLEIRLSDIDYDHSRRDIDIPYHSVNHFKIANNTTYQLGDYRIDGKFAFQNNIRKEFSEPVSHGYMPIPSDSLERKFNKNTYSGAISVNHTIADKHEISIGTNIEHQNNRRGGWGFIIPEFRTSTFGIFAHDRFQVNEKLALSAGIRFDRTETNIDSYHDWFKTPIENGDSIYKQRSADLKRTFNSVTWAAGINYNTGQWMLKANIGKSFRAPIAKELGSDGVNYNIFRYERGEANLSPEESYQIDAGINWKNEKFEIQFDPYINYFPNYIYLNPTAEYYEGLQVYYYTQSKVLRYGAEAQIKYNITDYLEFELQGEYLYAEQKSGNKKGYGLPFTPPWSSTIGARYMPQKAWSGKDGFVAINYKLVGEQDRIVPPEKKTKGYQTLNMSLGRSFEFGKQRLSLNLQAQNILNKKYYDHTSYYRLVEVPEPARNFTFLLGWNF